jgi:response regulator RpfG family c-di-GMP phosphodiesterase
MQAAVATVEELRVMLVDDDEIVRDAISEMLRRRGCLVSVFSDADSAINALTGGLSFDVMVSDINMPGLSGMDFLEKAKEAAPGIPVVMITGYPSIDVAVEAMKSGATDFLTKPFRAEELEIVIRKVVNEAREGGKEKEESRPRIRAVSKMPVSARMRLEDKIKELSILHTIAETLDEVSEKEEIFRMTMDLGQIITDSGKAFIMVVEPESDRLVVRASNGYGTGSIIGREFDVKEEPFSSVIRNKCYSNVLVENDRLGELTACGEAKSRRTPLLLTPLLINREVVVVMGLTGNEKGGEISNDTMALLLNLAAKASLKLENIALTENIFSSIIGAITSLINALDARDTYTKDHSNRVTRYALEIARAYSSSQDVLDSISFAGPLHDVGKIGIRDSVLLKQGSFTAEERELMKSHVVRGEEILRPLNLLEPEKAVVLYHHERWDGKGYPNGLAHENIPLCARIFSVADAFDAMTSTRPYRNALSNDVAKEEIGRCAGTQFDPKVVEAFLESIIVKEGPEGEPDDGK